MEGSARSCRFSSTNVNFSQKHTAPMKQYHGLRALMAVSGLRLTHFASSFHPEQYLSIALLMYRVVLMDYPFGAAPHPRDHSATAFRP